MFFSAGSAYAAPDAPGREIVLDAAHPFIDVRLEGMAIVLRVDPAQWDVIELNPEVAHRLRLGWRGNRDIAIGRVTLPGRWATAMLEVGDHALPVIVAEHGRRASEEADGVVGPDVLPFAGVRWRNAEAPPPTDRITLPLALDITTGLTAASPGQPVPVRLRFTLMRERSEATAAAGSLLAQRYGGHFEGEAMPLPVLFGISRPARPLRFDRAPVLAGFRFESVAVRIADFRGDNPLPRDPPADLGALDEIVVAGKDHPQPAQAWVTLARDRLSRCAEIAYHGQPRTITLACAFDR